MKISKEQQEQQEQPEQPKQPEHWMQLALMQAKVAALAGEVPIGCVIVRDGVLLAAAHNLRENNRDVTAHAEILALREASTLRDSWRLDGCEVYVTLEPCPMCASALQQARVAKVYYAAPDPKTGALVSTDRFFERPGLNHKVAYEGGLLEEEASAMLKQFFREKRSRNKALNKKLGGREARRKLMEQEGGLRKAKLRSGEGEGFGWENRPDGNASDPLS